MAPLEPVMTLALCPDPTPGVTLKDTSVPGAMLASLSISETESRLIITPRSETALSSASLTLTPVYMILSGVYPTFRQLMTSPMETASMPEPSCSSTFRTARLVFALAA